MTSPEERLALINLSDLLASDLTAADQDSLVAGIHEAEQTARRVRSWSGQLIAELRHRGLSWSRLVELTGVPQTTLHTRAQPHLHDD